MQVVLLVLMSKCILLDRMEKSLHKILVNMHPSRALFTSVFLLCLCMVQLEHPPEKGGNPYCHKTYFIQDYHAYEESTKVSANQGKWHGNESIAHRLSAERLISEINFLHNDLRRERSRRKSLVDFVDSLIRRYSNNSQVEQTWRRYYHKYSVDLPADDNGATAGPQSRPVSRQAELEPDDRKSERRSRKRGCDSHDRSETKKIYGMKSDITSLKNSYSAIYSAYTQLATSHRNLQRETRRYVQQGQRLRMFHMAEVQKLGWALANETDLWHAGVRYLMGKISCLQEENRHTEACLSLDPSPRPNVLREKKNDTRSSETRTGNRESQHNKLSKSANSDDEGKRKLIRQPHVRSTDSVRLVGKPKHVNARVKQPLAFEASLVTTEDGNDEEEEDEEVEGGIVTGTKGTVVTPTLSINYEQLKESFTEAGLEVFKTVMEQLKSTRPKDCSEIDLWVQRQEPMQTIYLHGRRRPTRVLCDDGWTVLQHNRHPPSSSQVPKAPSSWVHYRDGLGLPARGHEGQKGLFWIGNEYVHQLTKQGDYRLRIELGNQGWASYYKYSEYASFRVKSEEELYTLEVLGGSGTAGDVIGSFSAFPLSGVPFATRDRYNGTTQDRLTAKYGVGWWYPVANVMGAGTESCFTNLNAYKPWFCDQEGEPIPVDSVVMKIKPNSRG